MVLRFFTGKRRPGEPLSRREWLRIGGVAGLGLTLPRSIRSAGAARAANHDVPGFGRAKSIILVYASGGQSQLEMWDPKPDAPLEIRGDFAAIPTAVPGTFLGEHLPRVARLADRFAIVRSVSHDDLDHGSAGYLALTGQFHPNKTSNPPPKPTDFPTYGAILKRVRPDSQFPYSAVHLNGPALVPETTGPGQDGGFLGRDFEPLVLGDVNSTPIAVPCLDALPDLPAARLAARQNLMSRLDETCRAMERQNSLADRRLAAMDTLYGQAYQLLASPHCRQAFDLSAEPQAVRDRYGRNRSGQACLMARRLVEAGVPLITVIWNHSNRGQDKNPDTTDLYGWDTHNDIFDALKAHLLPRFDQGFSALLEDLDERGLLDQTLIVCMGEFGRAPLVALEKKFAGSSPGRKHWASVYSIVMAGAGVTPGAVYGSSDKIAAQPQTNRVTPGDVAATMFSALGIDPEAHYQDPLGRPYQIAAGRPITGLYTS
ncbi:MAG: DUF1501 domain-containing protein [Planctomycetia bacterium]|nr:DUF1501 domain-containing protein [Planctomycetia bacterium]